MPPPAAIRLGASHPYLKTHGTKVARLHMLDWIVLVLLAVIDVVLNLIEPFHRFVGEDMMATLRYPMKDNTVPVWAVPVVAVVGPVIIIAAIYMKRRNAYDLHHAILGLLFSVLITGVLTDAIKDGVGRPRPNFFWRCFPDGVPNYNNISRGVICHGDPGVIKEGHKSFPSGHTSWSFAGLGFLSWYLAGKIRAFDRGGHVAKLCIVLLPLLLAAMVAVSRVDDYWHHWQDVFTGGMLGLVVASFCYLQFFPPPSGDQVAVQPQQQLTCSKAPAMAAAVGVGATIGQRWQVAAATAGNTHGGDGGWRARWGGRAAVATAGRAAAARAGEATWRRLGPKLRLARLRSRDYKALYQLA